MGFGEVLAHGSEALVGRGVPGGVGWGCRRGKRTEVGVKHIGMSQPGIEPGIYDFTRMWNVDDH